MMSLIQTISNAFAHGGLLMWLIVPVHIASLVIIIERVMALYVRRELNQKQMVKAFEDDIRKGQIDKMLAKARRIESEPIAMVAMAGGQAAQDLAGKDEVQLRMDEVILEEQTRLEKRTGFLAMLGNVATLLGLLGTITGMIKSFAAVGTASPTEKAALLATGISEAMNATAYLRHGFGKRLWPSFLTVLETHPAAQGDLAGVVKGAQTAFAMFETALTRMDNVVLGSIRGGNSSSYSPMPG